MGHDYQDKVSLEIAQRIAAQLPHRPELLELARNNLDRWAEQNISAPSLLRCYDEWRAILAHPIPEIIAILTAETAEGQRLRQNSPFAGALPPEEVLEIKQRLRHDQSAA